MSGRAKRENARGAHRGQPELSGEELLVLGRQLRDFQQLDRNVLPPVSREQFDADNPLFQVRVDAGTGTPKLRWHPSDGEPEQVLSPSPVLFHILTRLLPGQRPALYRTVHNMFALEAGGETLGQMAEQNGWTGLTSDAPDETGAEA